MTHKERLATAWALRQPDRVPIEVGVISDHVRRHPRAGPVLELVAATADNLAGAPGMDYGFFGWPVARREETVIEDVPGRFRRKRCVLETAAGTFMAVTYHPAGELDYHWEKRFIASREEFRRLAETPRPALAWDAVRWRAAVAAIGDSALPLTGLPHPLGALVRNAEMELVYTWFYDERGAMHRFLESANGQVAAALRGMLADGLGPYYGVCAHEMLLPPWLGRELFDEFVFPYDRAVNDVLHRGGGKLRAHCHGNCMDFLERLADMGIDAIEPLEHPPAGNVDLAEAKRRVGNRMMLCGNVASERFIFATPDEVRAETRAAIRAAAAGGGFALRTSGGDAGTCMPMPDEAIARVLANIEAYLRAGLDYGRYPEAG